jgi:hypothetical protein
MQRGWRSQRRLSDYGYSMGTVEIGIIRNQVFRKEQRIINPMLTECLAECWRLRPKDER